LHVTFPEGVVGVKAKALEKAKAKAKEKAHDRMPPTIPQDRREGRGAKPSHKLRSSKISTPANHSKEALDARRLHSLREGGASQFR
jgi:hypothetical protein